MTLSEFPPWSKELPSVKVYTCQTDHVFNHLGETHLWVSPTVSSERAE